MCLFRFFSRFSFQGVVSCQVVFLFSFFFAGHFVSHVFFFLIHEPNVTVSLAHALLLAYKQTGARPGAAPRTSDRNQAARFEVRRGGDVRASAKPGRTDCRS